MSEYRSLACSLYCDRVRNRTPYCNPRAGFTCGGRYAPGRGPKQFLYPDEYCPSVEAAIEGMAATYPMMLASYEEATDER